MRSSQLNRAVVERRQTATAPKRHRNPTFQDRFQFPPRSLLGIAKNNQPLEAWNRGLVAFLILHWLDERTLQRGFLIGKKFIHRTHHTRYRTPDKSPLKGPRKFRTIIPLGCVLPLLFCCRIDATELFQFSKPEMGTVFHIRLYAGDKAAAQRAADAAFTRIEDINQIASDYLPESELSRFNKAPANEAIPISTDLFALLQKSNETAKMTDGAFDITCTYAVQNWRRAKRQKKLPAPEQTAHAIAMTDWRALMLDPMKRTATKTLEGLLLDLGGIGKGYAANEALLVLKLRGITRALVAGSGDIAIGDPPPGKEGWDVALRTFEKPEESDKFIHLTLHNCGVSTSGDLHQFLELDGVRWSHIIDPKTGLSLTIRIACTVIAPTAFESDPLATALCVMGTQPALALMERLSGCHARFVVLEDGTPRVSQTLGFPPRL